ncbi:MAG TPA: universal stress protein [Aquifex aeolicus]|nr:universal stress protein [Aquifex aeolicus]
MRFLVPIDFSDITNPLLRTVKRLADRIPSEIFLLHVIPPVVYLPYPETMGISVIDIEMLKKIEKEKKEEAIEKLRGIQEFLKPHRTETFVEIGDPADTILEYEDRLKPDFVFLGGHKKGLIEKILIGSTTEKVVKYGKKSDFVVKGGEVDFNKKVVIAYDFSQTCQKALEFSIDFLKNFKVKVDILHVDEPIEVPLIEKLKVKVHEKFSEEKRRILTDLKKKFEEKEIETNIVYLEGKNPVEAITDYINNNEDVELLIIGSKGLSGLKRLILGNTATRLISKINKPILIYKVVG